ncbi:MAG: hypothetical protein P1Q69_11460 [Candidatus Thorarchaeota archaeon]|nr:hypothetical protein [Candidatus Thorarchaeota archaeon]
MINKEYEYPSGVSIVDNTKLCGLLRNIVTVEFLIAFLWGIFVTNMSPIWMQFVFYIAGGLFLITTAIWLIVCVAIPWWKS